MSSVPRPRLPGFRSPRRPRPARGLRRLAFQPLESRRLLAIIGDWAVLDLRAQLSDDTYSFRDLSGVTFYGDQLAVTANVQQADEAIEGRLLLIDYDLAANTAEIATNLTVPSLGGSTQTLAVNTDGTVIYVTGSSNSAAAPARGEAFRAVWDGTTIQTEALGSIPGLDSPNPVFQSVGVAVTSTGVVTGTSDHGRAIFEYDQSMEYAGEMSVGIAYGISEDRVKVGLDSFEAFIWEADQTRRVLEDPSGDGVFAFGISPDHSIIVGSGILVGWGGATFEKAFWWDYDTASAHVVYDGNGVPVRGRLTSATNADVGYLVGRSVPAEGGDLIHLVSTNETQKIVDWFEAYSGVTIPAETSEWGPEVAYDDASGNIVIISGGHLFAVKIWDDNLPPVAVDDAFSTPTDVPLEVSAPGVLENDTDDGGAALTARLVAGPLHGELDLRSDGSFTYTPDPGYNREDFFTYRAFDGSYESEIASVNITIETEFPWHNGLNPLDVNDDGSVSPSDALAIINALNDGKAGPLSPTRPRPLSKNFYDVGPIKEGVFRPDNYLSPSDALLIINYLNRRASEAEGEAGVVPAGDVAGDHLIGAASTDLRVAAPAAAPAAAVASGAAADAVWAGAGEVATPLTVEIGWAAERRSAAADRSEGVGDVWGSGLLEDVLAELCGEVTDD